MYKYYDEYNEIDEYYPNDLEEKLFKESLSYDCDIDGIDGIDDMDGIEPFLNIPLSLDDEID